MHDSLMEKAIRRSIEKHRKKRRRRLASRASRLNKRAKRVNASGRVTGAQLWELVEVHGSRCYYCAALLNFSVAATGRQPRDATFDHIIPLGRGGRGDLSNLVPACLQCNNDKDRQPSQKATVTMVEVH